MNIPSDQVFAALAALGHHTLAVFRDRRTRFAPTPSGGLHFGSLVAACASFLSGKVSSGRWILRFDDLDTQRNAPGAVDLILSQLESFGLCWDGEPVLQSTRVQLYLARLEEWCQRGFIFACSCSRQELDRILVQRNAWGERIYPGTCRGCKVAKLSAAPKGLSLRLDLRAVVRDGQPWSEFRDCVQGMQRCNLLEEWPAPVLLRADGVVSYHLANAVDDDDLGITHIVRGADLLGVTHLHRLLEFLIDGSNPIVYGHVPIVVDPDGRKLSKSHRDQLASWSSGQQGAQGRGHMLRQALEFLGFDTGSMSWECSEILGQAQWALSNTKTTRPVKTDPENL